MTMRERYVIFTLNFNSIFALLNGKDIFLSLQGDYVSESWAWAQRVHYPVTSAFLNQKKYICPKEEQKTGRWFSLMCGYVSNEQLHPGKLIGARSKECKYLW